jgi:hypothetical protein
MLKSLLWRQHRFTALLVCLALQPWGSVHAGSGGLAALEAQSVPVLPRIVSPGSDAAPRVQQGCDTLGVANECFDPLGTTYLSVASFFDSREPIESDHYFLKLFQNTTGDSVRLTGMGFYTQSDTEETNRFQAAGAIVTGQDLVFPESQALLDLLRVNIPGEPEGSMTCVNFTGAVDPKGRSVSAVIGPGDWAWVALRFPELGAGRYVRIRVDADSNDQPCDYMTHDGGRHWFRPDPRNGPAYDWGITVFTQSKSSRPVAQTEPTWTLVKRLYR